MTQTKTVEDLIVRWTELKDQGKEPSVESLCADRPDLIDLLRDKIKFVRRIRNIGMIENSDGVVTGNHLSINPDRAGPVAAILVEGQSSKPNDESQDRIPNIPGYEILGVLGRGGMGIVFKARDSHLDRMVAIKMILAGAYASTERIDRFEVEAKAIARIKHINVVDVYEAKECDGNPYLVMEYVGGGDLAAKINGRPQSPRYAAAVVKALARVIHQAHTEGIVHRDLKPQNILLSSEGTPKVSDFGLAKLIESKRGHTLTGDVLGTPCYMAPEQASGKVSEIGPKTDVYSLGTILYEMLTGMPPFRGDSPLETLKLVQYHDPVPPRQIKSDVPIDLQNICIKALEKESSRRYSTAEQFASDLQCFLDGRSVQARNSGRLRRTWRWISKHRVSAALTSLAMIFSLLIMLIVFSMGSPQSVNGDPVATGNSETRNKSKMFAREPFAAATAYPLPPDPSIAQQADFDNDGNLDIAVVNGNKIGVLYGKSDGTFESIVNHSPGGTGTWGVATGDINGNGRHDLIVSNYRSGTLRILINNGDRTFDLSAPSLFIFEGNDVKAADVNNDGHLDVAATSQGGRYITVWHGKGDGTFGSGQSYDAGVGPRTLTIADVSGDGWKDILVANSWGGGAGSVGVYINKGDGTYADGVQYAVQHDPQNVGVGKFNADSVPDLVISNAGSKSFSMLLGNGDGTFRKPIHHTADSPYGLAVADMDDDGHDDIVFTNMHHGTVEVWFSDGRAKFHQKLKYSVGNGPFAVTLNDANHDGYYDMFVTNNSDKSISVLLSQNRSKKIVASGVIE